MQIAFWLVLFGALIVVGGTAMYSLRKLKEKQLAEEERVAAFMAATAGSKIVEAAIPAAPAPQALGATPKKSTIVDILAAQKLLFEAAHKAGEAGEPALAIQLYARLLARFPQSAFADQARAAAAAQKKKLAKA
jgi:hypothetical protein